MGLLLKNCHKSEARNETYIKTSNN